eukprot:1389044-Rhodomonas_salina.4
MTRSCVLDERASKGREECTEVTVLRPTLLSVPRLCELPLLRLEFGSDFRCLRVWSGHWTTLSLSLGIDEA